MPMNKLVREEKRQKQESLRISLHFSITRRNQYKHFVKGKYIKNVKTMSGKHYFPWHEMGNWPRKQYGMESQCGWHLFTLPCSRFCSVLNEKYFFFTTDKLKNDSEMEKNT